MYPFNFLLRISYKLESSKLLVNYEVENLSEETMYFSIGAHPAFNIPLTKQTAYEDYFFEFEKEENSSRYVVNGNFLGGPVPYFNNQTQLALKKSLFYDEALIFKDLKSDWISIKSTKNAHGIKFDFPGFPYMGIWSATDAPFVCIEPWCGIPDSENHSQHIEEKEGIIPLEKNSRSIKSWSIDFF
jgi:galactose mutarotase-like enzyme